MSNIPSSDFIDFAFRKTHQPWLIMGGVCIGGFGFDLPLSSSYCGSSSSSSVINTNAQRRLEQFIRQKYAAYEIAKSRGKRALPGSNIIINFYTTELIRSPSIGMPLTTEFIETEFVSYKMVDAIVEKNGERKMEENRNNSMLGPMGSVSTDSNSHQNSLVQQPGPTTSKTLAIGVNKSTLPKKAKRNAAHKVTKTNVSKKQVDIELQQSRQRWERERDVIARTPTYLDLYCAGFEPAELDAISDLLQPLLASDDDANVIPWAESGAPLELVMA